LNYLNLLLLAMRVLAATAALLLLATVGSCLDSATVVSPSYASALSGEARGHVFAEQQQ
jgi:hypothetical protein